MKRNDLVMMRLPNKETEFEYKRTHYNTWFRVKFIDNDGTFIGEVEKIDRWEFTLYKVGEHVRLSTDKILHIYKRQ